MLSTQAMKTVMEMNNSYIEDICTEIRSWSILYHARYENLDYKIGLVCSEYIRLKLSVPKIAAIKAAITEICTEWNNNNE